MTYDKDGRPTTHYPSCLPEKVASSLSAADNPDNSAEVDEESTCCIQKTTCMASR